MNESPPPRSTPPRAAPSRVLEQARCALTVLSGGERGREQVADRDVFRIGKSDDNDFVLSDTTVSRAHCEIVREPKGFLVRDRDSTNGTLLDGAEIKEAWLKPGAVITVGKIEIKVRPFIERIEITPSPREELAAMVGTSPAMRLVFAFLDRVSRSDTSLLIEGEPGTGKYAAARTVHVLSTRRDAPFVEVDCAKLFGTAGESELFGHDRGAFPGASTPREGALETVRGGTLFLRNVVDLPVELQARLLKVLEQRSSRRLGSSKETRFAARIIATTSRNLEAAVQRGMMNEELRVRLAGATLEMPALRSRTEDVPLLVPRFLSIEAHRAGKAILTVRPETVAMLRAQPWPGNVRELEDWIKQAAQQAYARGSGNIDMALGGSAESYEFDSGLSYRDTRGKWEAIFEVAFVRWLLAKHRGNISAASRAADMDRKYLHKLAKKHGIERTDSEL